MKYILSDRVIEIANKVSKIPGLKMLLKPIYYRYKTVISNRRNELFRSNALMLLKEFDKCLNEIGVEYSMAYGSLLGAIREHGFIKHDLDLDVFIWIDDFSEKIHEILLKNGFKLEHRFLVENGELGREETYSKYDVSIDIFYVYPSSGNYPYACSFYPWGDAVTWGQSMKKYGKLLAQKWDTPIGREFELVKFETMYVKVTKNYDEFLKFTYGDDYMIPNPNYHGEDSKHYIDWIEVNAIIE